MKKPMTYMDSVHRDGRIWNLSVMVLLLAFPISVAVIFGVSPDWHALLMGLIATAPMYWAVGAIETITFVPMLGAGGSYLSFVTGNISNLKLPCALNALEQNHVSATSEEGELVSTIAIATSSIVTTLVILVGVILIVPLTPILEGSGTGTGLCPDAARPVWRLGCGVCVQELENRHCPCGADADSLYLCSRPQCRNRGHYGACQRCLYHCCFQNTI